MHMNGILDRIIFIDSITGGSKKFRYSRRKQPFLKSKFLNREILISNFSI